MRKLWKLLQNGSVFVSTLCWYIGERGDTPLYACDMIGDQNLINYTFEKPWSLRAGRRAYTKKALYLRSKSKVKVKIILLSWLHAAHLLVSTAQSMTGHLLDASTGTQPSTKPHRPAHVTGYRDNGPSNGHAATLHPHCKQLSCMQPSMYTWAGQWLVSWLRWVSSDLN